MDSETLLGHQLNSVTGHTEDFTLTRQDNGTRHTTVGAAGAVVANLPEAIPGMHFGFRVGAAQEFRLEPLGTNTISLPSNGVPGAAGKYLTANAVGELCYLECFVAGNWDAIATGTWTAEA